MDLVELERCQNELNAHLLSAALQSYGLHPTVAGDAVANLISPDSVPIQILIPASERDRAAAILAVVKPEMLRHNIRGPASCPTCGEGWDPGTGPPGSS